MLSVVILSVVMLSVIMLSVVAPSYNPIIWPYELFLYHVRRPNAFRPNAI
jgi:hypothetical protein